MKINEKLLQIKNYSGWSFNTTYITGTGGYTRSFVDQTTCFANFNFSIDVAVSNSGTTLVSGLPKPFVRTVFTCMVGATPVRMRISENGELQTDGTNTPTGWVSANVTYPYRT